jgi:hypothetical protein
MDQGRSEGLGAANGPRVLGEHRGQRLSQGHRRDVRGRGAIGPRIAQRECTLSASGSSASMQCLQQLPCHVITRTLCFLAAPWKGQMLDSCGSRAQAAAAPEHAPDSGWPSGFTVTAIDGECDWHRVSGNAGFLNLFARCAPKGSPKILGDIAQGSILQWQHGYAPAWC